MAIILSCQSISKSYFAKTLFTDLTLGIHDGDKLGIIGPNGTGKSTLLRLLSGSDSADSGEITRRRHLRTAYVEQMRTFAASDTIISVLTDAARQSGCPEEEIEGRIATWTGLTGFLQIDAKVSELSGGWKKRLAIAAGLITDPELLLLDEPTNHLDVLGMLWLEQLLKQARFGWVMVSHDRYFLDRTVRRVAELSPAYKDGAFVTEGTYSEFLVKREDYRIGQQKLQETLANKVRRETDWLARSPQARATKARYRIDEAHRLIDELRDVKTRSQVSESRIEFSASGRKTKKLITAEGVAKKMGEKPIVNNLDLVLTAGMSLGLLGGNGTGKTTILNLLKGELDADAGKVVQADQLKIVSFDQNREQLDPQWTLKRALSDTGESVIFQGRSVHVASWAKRFGLSADQLHVKVGDLSGGEQARVLIARLMLKPADVLLLDEPTNDLDIPTLEVLEESLEEFAGALVLVTHDRFMLSRVCNLYLGLDGQGGTELYADYEQWEKALGATIVKPERAERDKSKEPRDRTPAPLATSSSKNKASPNKRLSYMEQREYDHMEANIEAAEKELASWQTQAEDPAHSTQSHKLLEIGSQMKTLEDRIASLYIRWTELEAKLQ